MLQSANAPSKSFSLYFSTHESANSFAGPEVCARAVTAHRQRVAKRIEVRRFIEPLSFEGAAEATRNLRSKAERVKKCLGGPLARAHAVRKTRAFIRVAAERERVVVFERGAYAREAFGVA